jgi:hypothetical protein
MCRQLTKETCVKSAGYSNIPYYCNIGGVCKEYKGTINNNQISANNCGTDPLNNQILLPYASKAECEKTVDVCDKYNDPLNSKHTNEKDCLKDNVCGFCKNDTGNGKCISGTISGPLDLEKYYYCDPADVSGKNSYKYGNHVDYILQPPPEGLNYNSFRHQSEY